MSNKETYQIYYAPLNGGFCYSMLPKGCNPELILEHDELIAEITVETEEEMREQFKAIRTAHQETS